MSCLGLLERTFGSQSSQFQKFNDLFPKFHDFTPIKKALGILKSAKEDYEGGFAFDSRAIIEAEVFGDFLEQATYLCESGYFQAAAVLAGSTLEDALRRLCNRAGIILSSKPKLELMNTELAKKGIYNTLTQKMVTYLADIRNKAAHGKVDEFCKDDVTQMIKQIRSFLESFFQ
jgi:hypothetical protein